MWHGKCAARVVACMMVSLVGLGCGGSTEPPRHEAPLSYQRLKAIQRAYLMAMQDLQRPPQKAAEIMPYLHHQGEGGPEALLRSPDDDQPYKIFWGVDALRPGEDGQFPVLAYEQQGKDGERYVMDARYIYRKTDEELLRAPVPAGNGPAS